MGGTMLLFLLLYVPVVATVESQLLFPTPVVSTCKSPVHKCEQLENSECMGVTLPYSSTSVALAGDSDNQSEVAERLMQWSGLRYVPKCWEVVQPLLCAVYMPKCDDANNTIELPGLDMCEQTREPCKIVADTLGWPSFLMCNQPHFVEGCGSSISNLKFNTTGSCNPPLIRTDNKESWFGQAEGCGIQCQNPLFTEEEHEEMHLFIAILGSLCMACTLFTVLTFLIDWKNASRYPALILFFINCCFFIGSVGWMAQFWPGAREDIVCKKDGTQRRSEPKIGSGENLTCTVVFVLVYYFMIAGITWFVILAYAWNLTFRAFGSAREALEPHKAIFHIAAWSIPLVLTIVCLAITQIDGDSLSGICFVGYMDHLYRGLFVLLPVGMVLVVGLIFLMSGLVTLWKLQCTSPGLLSDRASARIRETIIRIGLFAGFALIFVMITLVVHIYIFVNEQGWHNSFEEYILCEARIDGEKLMTRKEALPMCQLQNTPKLIAMEIHVFAYFGAGIVMSSWVWNKSTLHAWKRFIRRVCGTPSKEPVKLRKHEVIAQAFQKRKDIQAGRLSLSFASTHDDPLGMKFDVNSISSQEMTSVWASALPRMVMRRGALVYPAMMGRRHSDSDIESIKSVSSLQQKLAQLQKEAANYNSYHRRRHSESQNSQSDKSDRSRRKKRRHRKRGRNRVIPSSSPSVQGTVPSQNEDDSLPRQNHGHHHLRRESINSNGTNPSLTNISQTPSSATTGNQRVNTSDEDRGLTPETREGSGRGPGRRAFESGSKDIPGNLPTGRKKASSAQVKADILTIEHNDNANSEYSENFDEEASERIGSSDEERVTPEMSRPPIPPPSMRQQNIEDSLEEDEIEDIHSSDEDRTTPIPDRPHLDMVAPVYKTPVQPVHPHVVQCVNPQQQHHVNHTNYTKQPSPDIESVHSSDEERATPEMARPHLSGMPDLEKGEGLPVQAHTNYQQNSDNNTKARKSLLDRVIELHDPDDSDDEFNIENDNDLDIEVANISEDRDRAESRKRRRLQATLNAKYNEYNNKVPNTHHRVEKETEYPATKNPKLGKKTSKVEDPVKPFDDSSSDENSRKESKRIDVNGIVCNNDYYSDDDDDDNADDVFINNKDLPVMTTSQMNHSSNSSNRLTGTGTAKVNNHKTKRKDKYRNNHHNDCENDYTGNNGRRNDKYKGSNHHNGNNSMTRLQQAWSPETPVDQGRSKSPVMSAFKKVKDWMNAPVQTPTMPLTPVERPDFDMHISKLVLGQNHGGSGGSVRSLTPTPPPLVVVPRVRRHKRSKGRLNTGYEESEA